MTRTFRGTALAVIAPAVLAAVLAGCSDKKDNADETATADRPTVEVTAQPQDAQTAQVTAEQVFENLSGGDWAGAWELWTDTAQSAIAKDAYVDLVSTCTSAGGVSLTFLEQPTATADASTAMVRNWAARGSETVIFWILVGVQCNFFRGGSLASFNVRVP